MKQSHQLALICLAIGSAFATTHVLAAEETQAALTAEAKITEAQARKTALAKVPKGSVKSAELEREHGRLVWSFDLSRHGVNGVTEVQVDAKSGKIASIKRETAAQETKEAKAERAETPASK